VVVGTTALTSLLLYLDRFCLGMAIPYVRDELHLTDTQAGWALSIFFLSYSLAQVPSGYLSDRFGGRLMLALYVVGWSVFTAAVGLVAGLTALLAARLLVGAAQAGAYPTAANLVSKWVPFSRRGAASALIAFGGRVGGFIAPVLTAYLIVQFVPRTQSSQLGADDLKDPVLWCAKVLPPPTDAPTTGSAGDATPARPSPAVRIGRKVLQRATAEELQLVEQAAQAAARYQAAQRAAARSGTDGSPAAVASATAPELSPREREMLRGLLNRAIADPTLAAAEDFADLANCEQEALALLPRLQELSPLESERLNRLLLEAVFPESIRKLYVAGWRPVMFVYGGAGLLVALLYWWLVRDHPAAHPGCNAAELALIAHGRPPSVAESEGRSAGGVPLRPLLVDGSMWLMCLVQFTTNLGWAFLPLLLPTFLLEEHHVPIIERGWMASVPLALGMLGMLAGGRITDWAARRLGIRWGRALPVAFTRFLAAIAYLLVFLLPLGPWAATLVLALVAIGTDMGSPAVWAFMQDVGGRNVGSILGWGNMWGNFGALVCAPLLLAIQQQWGYSGAFLFCAAAFAVSGLAALGINAEVPINPPVRRA
jgi:MFS family permease